MRLHINVDHVATVRQARRTDEPDPVRAAVLAELGGADGITVHLREDRRHIQERDVLMMKDALQTRMNFEMGVTEAMLAFAEQLCPEHVCLVPETRQELTTEGGLDVLGQEARIREAVERLRGCGAEVSLFIDADPRQIEAAARVGAPAIELHTGEFAEAWKHVHTKDGRNAVAREVVRLCDAAAHARGAGLDVHAGHGLTYENVAAVAAIDDVEELNIGHSVVSRAVLVGMERAVREMKSLIMTARTSRPAAG